MAGKRRGIYSIAPNNGWNDQQLTKNCGIVPYLFHKRYGYRAVMVGTRMQAEYPSLEHYVKGVEMDFLPDAEWETECQYLDDNYQDMTVDFPQKEKVILTVGRVGSAQKRNEKLLEAFAKIYQRLLEWTVRLVGKVEPEFRRWLHGFCLQHPKISQQIVLTGPIFEKKKLLAEYKRAKIFALNSVYKGGERQMLWPRLCIAVAT